VLRGCGLGGGYGLKSQNQQNSLCQQEPALFQWPFRGPQMEPLRWSRLSFLLCNPKIGLALAEMLSSPNAHQKFCRLASICLASLLALTLSALGPLLARLHGGKWGKFHPSNGLVPKTLSVNAVKHEGSGPPLKTSNDDVVRTISPSHT